MLVKSATRLPSVFDEGNICLLAGYRDATTTTPEKTLGSPWRSTKLSAMRSRVLSLHLDGLVHSLEESRLSVRYLSDCPPHYAEGLDRCEPPRVVAIRRVAAAGDLTLILIDELIGRPIAVIGDALAWRLEGLDVRLSDGRNEQAL